MRCYVELDTQDYTITISFKRLCQILDINITDEDMDKAIAQVITES